MAARRFVVYQDTPAPSAPAPSLESPSNVLAPSNSEKENIHPVTGKAALLTKNADKTSKEKGTALATKFYIEDSVLKKKKKLAMDGAVEDGCPEPKKRKSASSSSSQAKGKKPVSKVVVTTTRVRKTTRRAPPLPSLEEDSGDERSATTQAAINSRCVELTVKSLADVSEAFEISSVVAKPTETKSATAVAKLSADVKHRDYFAVPLSSLTITPLTKTACPHDLKSQRDDESSDSNDLTDPTKPSIEAHAFSTPERKQIYSAFTFSSPSPASKRLTEKPMSLDIDTIALFENLTLDFKD
jgi:hypothetical protein